MEDSLISKWTENGRKVTLFGDDTWTRLFPGKFLRQDPVTSFFVSDYKEVDDNVTRHLGSEMNRDDWDVMILHYLGLDHIGHLEGPGSRLVQPKLDEMGDIIQTVWGQMHRKTKDGQPPMMIIVGDHGMADGGGHGGSSPSEVLVPCVILGGFGIANRLPPVEIHQVDLAPSLAMLTGVPIPSGSVGSVIEGIAQSLPASDHLDIIKHNAEHLHSLVTESGLKPEYDLMEMGLKAESDNNSQLATEAYSKAIRKYQEQLLNQSSNYDLYQMFLAITMLTLLMLSSLIVILRGFSSGTSSKLSALMWILCPSLLLHLAACSSQPGSELCSLTPATALKLLCSFATITLFWAETKDCPTKIILKIKGIISQASPSSLLISGATLAAIFSLCSSSFVEEEHQTHYFIFCSLSVVLIRESKSKEEVIKILLVIMLHRIQRSFNQTGDKWKHLPDVKDDLMKPESFVLRTALYILSLASFVLSNSGAVSSLYVRLKKLGLSILLIARKSGSIDPTLIEQFYFLLVLSNLIFTNRSRRDLLFETFVYLSLILHSDINTISIVMLLIQLNLLSGLVEKIPQPCQSLLIMLLMKVSFFYFGNSNSLSTIDVGAGYTGMVAFMPVVVTSLMAIHTYTGPIVVMAYFVKNGLDVDNFLNVLFHHSLLEIITFCLVSTVMRYHIFVWTVFSPKLLYLGMNLMINSVMSVLVKLVDVR